MNILVLLGCLGLTFTAWGANFQSKNELSPAFLNFPLFARESSIHFDKADQFWKFFKLNKDNADNELPTVFQSDDPPKHYSKHHVSLQYFNDKPGRWSHFCSATLINKCSVLTTTMCMFYFTKVSTDLRLKVVVGAYDVNGEVEKSRQYSFGISVFVHPLFDPFTWEHDFMVISVKDCFTMNQHVEVKKIADSSPSPSRACVYSGWNLFDSSDEKVLKNQTMEVMSRRDCVDFYKKVDFDVPHNMFCATSNNGNNDVWDVGGPLVCGESVSGIAHFPETFEGDAYYPALFNDVSKVKSWIDSTTCNRN